MRTKYDLKRLFTIPVENGIGEQLRMDAAENGEEDQLNSKKAVTLVML